MTTTKGMGILRSVPGTRTVFEPNDGDDESVEVYTPTRPTRSPQPEVIWWRPESSESVATYNMYKRNSLKDIDIDLPEDENQCLGWCRQCFNAGPIGYECREVLCPGIYLRVIGTNRFGKPVQRDAMLFMPLVGSWHPGRDYSETRGLTAVDKEKTMKWAYPIAFPQKELNEVCTDVYEGRLSTLLGVAQRTVKALRAAHMRISEDMCEKASTQSHEQRDLYSEGLEATMRKVLLLQEFLEEDREAARKEKKRKRTGEIRGEEEDREAAQKEKRKRTGKMRGGLDCKSRRSTRRSPRRASHEDEGKKKDDEDDVKDKSSSKDNENEDTGKDCFSVEEAENTDNSDNSISDYYGSSDEDDVKKEDDEDVLKKEEESVKDEMDKESYADTDE